MTHIGPLGFIVIASIVMFAAWKLSGYLGKKFDKPWPRPKKPLQAPDGDPMH